MSIEVSQIRTSDLSSGRQHFLQTPHVTVTQKPEDLVFENKDVILRQF